MTSVAGNFGDIDLIAQENAKRAQEEIDRIAKTIANYDGYRGMSSADIHKEISKVLTNKSASAQEQLEQSIPLLRLLRIDSLKTIQDSCQKPTESWKISDANNLKQKIETLSTIPPIVFFESLIKGVASSRTQLTSSNALKIAESDKKLHATKIAQVADLSSKLLETYLNGVREFAGQPKSSTELSEAQFDICLGSLQNDISRAELGIDQVAHRKTEELLKATNEVSSAKFQLGENQTELVSTRDKDRKPAWRRFARFVTGGKFPKAVDTSQIETDIETARNRVADCEGKLEETTAHYNQIESEKQNILSALQNSLSVATSLKEQFLAQDDGVDISANATREFLAEIENNPDLQAKFEAEAKKALVIEEKKGSLSGSIGSHIERRTNIAQYVVDGDVEAKPKLTQRTLARVSAALEMAEAVPGVGFVAMAVNAISKFNDRRVEKEFEAVSEFSRNPNGKKILEALGAYLSNRFSELPIAADSLDDFSDSLTKKVVRAVATKAGGLDASDDVDVAVGKIVKYLQKQQFVFNNKMVKVEPEFARDGAKYKAAGFIARQAIIVLDENGQEKTLIPKSRQKTDEKIGSSKYEVRRSTPGEQEKFNRNGKLTDYAEFIPKIDRLANALSGTLDKVELKDGLTKEAAIEKIKSIVEDCKSLKGKDLSANLKTSLSQMMKLGKRSGVSNTPDEDRKNFNIVKNSLIKMIELGETKSGESKVAVAINSIQQDSVGIHEVSDVIDVEQSDLHHAGESHSTELSEAVSLDDISITAATPTQDIHTPKDDKRQKIVDTLASKSVTLIEPDLTKSKEEKIVNAADKIMEIVETIATKVKDGKTKNFDDELKEALKEVVKLGNRNSFTRKADPDRKVFNEIKDTVSEIITSTAKEMHKGGHSIQDILKEGRHENKVEPQHKEKQAQEI